MGNTPAELGYKPWTLDYTPDKDGLPDLPPYISNPYSSATNRRRFSPDDWDPPLRANNAVLQFAVKVENSWTKLGDWLTVYDETWDNTNPLGGTPQPPPPGPKRPRHRPPQTIGEERIYEEIGKLLALMEDDRDRYLAEILPQADGVLFYYMSLLGMNPSTKPWTRALMAFALQAGDFVAMKFKYKYDRIRPSSLCPGLLVPFGPPRHPAFPSGHSTQCHLLSYVLLQIPNVRTRFGDELVWLARRVAIGRERAGLHYRSDSTAGMHLALGVIEGLRGFGSETALRNAVLERKPDPNNPREDDAFGDFNYPNNPVSLKCREFYHKPPNKQPTGLLPRAMAEWRD
jgi:hypothetical protein